MTGNFEFRYNHNNENATWYANSKTKFALPSEDVIVKCNDPYLNETQFLEMVRRFFIACGYTEKQWKESLIEHIKEVQETE